MVTADRTGALTREAADGCDEALPDDLREPGLSSHLRTPTTLPGCSAESAGSGIDLIEPRSKIVDDELVRLAER